jgi:hypothetical protein
MPIHKSDYEDAESYLDDVYRPEDNEDLEFEELTIREQEHVIKDTFHFRQQQAAHEMRVGLDRPYGQRRGRYRVFLKGHLHHVQRDSLGRFSKWLD